MRHGIFIILHTQTSSSGKTQLHSSHLESLFEKLHFIFYLFFNLGNILVFKSFIYYTLTTLSFPKFKTYARQIYFLPCR